MHARSLAVSKADFEFAGAFDPDDERAAEFASWSGATVCPSPEDVIESCDAVYVCTWTSEHAALVDLAAQQGKAVFCEKPLAVDLAGTRSMTEAVERAGVTNQVGLVMRSSRSFALLKDLIADPASGRMLSITFHDDQILPIHGWYASTWRSDPAKAGSGVLLEHSIHDVDMIERLGGPLNSISAHAARVHDVEHIEDVVTATFRYESGALGTLTTVWHDIPERLNDRRVEVVCERLWAALEGDSIGPVRWQRPGESPQSLQGEALLAEVKTRGLKTKNPDGAFVTAVAEGRPASPDFADALRAHVVVDAAYRSAAAGGQAVATT
jgi:myo-inositol 2-dehydrogenase/D-chiro-inositol 1-dehydrogenase